MYLFLNSIAVPKGRLPFAWNASWIIASLEQGILILLLPFAAQLLLPGTVTIFKLLANGWCRWEIFGKRSIQFSKRVPDSTANSKMRLDSSILADNPLAVKLAIC